MPGTQQRHPHRLRAQSECGEGRGAQAIAVAAIVIASRVRGVASVPQHPRRRERLVSRRQTLYMDTRTSLYIGSARPDSQGGRARTATAGRVSHTRRTPCRNPRASAHRHYRWANTACARTWVRAGCASYSK
ncbi:hypothetical protein B0H12DRAFT_207456 [Mycena haematopus]|nr:hypothetical protein B0H12DRAFT_207456 [Mycena haematopus]